MHLDVQDLRRFYYQTALGRAAQRVLREGVVAWWPEAKGQTVAGFGFAVPILRPYLADARRVIALMPGPQGVMAWPAGEPNVSVLCEETAWPIETGQIDKLVVLHGLEPVERSGEILDEIHRVLGPGGRVLFLVANRSGLWARRERTPFGFGRPFSAGQLETLLREKDFQIERAMSLLYQPPSERRFWLRSAWFWERAGRGLPMLLAGGVLMVEASKRVRAPVRPGLGAVVRTPLRALEGMGEAGAEPA